MNIKLIDGQFNSHDALNIISDMIGVKIKFHEGKILDSSSEEDIKMRENKIKFLQNELHELRKNIATVNPLTSMKAVIEVFV